MGGIIFQIIATIIEAFLLKHMTFVDCERTFWDSKHKTNRKITETKIGLYKNVMTLMNMSELIPKYSTQL